MHGPAVVGWLLVAVCGGTGAYCLVRAGRGRLAGRRAAGVEAAMGLGMAAMALPWASLPGWPRAAGAVALVGCFAAVGVWALLPGPPAAHRGHHAVESWAMVSMALAMGGQQPAGHGAHAAGGTPVLTGALLAYFALYALATGPRLLPAARGVMPRPDPVPGDGARRPSHGPRGECAAPEGSARPPEVAAACRLALALAMVAMLLPW